MCFEKLEFSMIFEFIDVHSTIKIELGCGVPLLFIEGKCSEFLYHFLCKSVTLLSTFMLQYLFVLQNNLLSAVFVL